LLLIFVAVLLVSANAEAVITTVGSNADTYMRDATVRGAYLFMDIRGAASDFGGYLCFDLSSLNIATISSTTLTLTKANLASRNDTITTGRFALYGLDNVAGNTPQNWDESTLSETGTNPVGFEWSDNWGDPLVNVTNLDMEDVPGITETVVNGGAEGGTVSVIGAPLVSFIQGRVNDNGLVTFIIKNDDSADRGYGLATKEHGTESYRPVLTLDYTEIPEPATIALLGLGGLSLLRIRKRR
jgi:hypothetical protein